MLGADVVVAQRRSPPGAPLERGLGGFVEGQLAHWSAFGSCGACRSHGVHLAGGEAALADGLRRQPFRLGEERCRQLRRGDCGGNRFGLPAGWPAWAIDGEVIGGEQYPNGVISGNGRTS